MQSLVYEYLFLILLVLGGVIVTIRATELFSTPVPSNDAQWLNDEMHLRHLTGIRQYATGFLFYLLPVLLVYSLLSVSPELLSLSMGVAGTSSSVGALSLNGSDVYTFAPVLAATAVITLLNIKPFSAVEQYLRRMSHGIAGIPQHIQDIIRQIRLLDFQSMTSDSSLRNMQPNNGQPIPGLDSDLAVIDNVNEWIFGATGMLVWSDKANLALQLSMQRITTDYEAMKRKLMTMRPMDGHVAGTDASILLDDALESVARQTRELRINFTRLLAVLIANQDERLSAKMIPYSLCELLSNAQAKRASSHHFNTLAASTLTGIVISIPIVALYNFLFIVFNGLSMSAASLDISSNQLLIAGNLPGEFYRSSLMYAAEAASWDVMGVSLIFFTGCTLALNYRAGKVNTERWGLWHSRNHPVFQYVVVAIMATLGAALFYGLFLFFKLVAWPSLRLQNPANFASMLSDFGRHYVQFGVLALLAAPCSVMACRLSDKVGSPSEYPKLWQDSQVGLLVFAVGMSSMIIYMLLRVQLDNAQSMGAVFVSALIPSFTLFVMTASFWRLGESRPPNVILLPHIEPEESLIRTDSREQATV